MPSGVRDETLDAPANRAWLIDQVTRGVEIEAAAKALGMAGVHTVQRHARRDKNFREAFKRAKNDGRRARKKHGPREPSGDCPVNPPIPPSRRKPDHVWLEEAELVEPEGLMLNPHLPRLSVRSHLGMCQRMAYDKSEHPAIRREAMRQIGMHTLLPALRPPPAPPRNETGTVAEVHQPALAIPGTGPRVVVLKAPDNGMYAPGCGPGDATVVDEAEAADAELVTPG